ncbi:MAG: universal stress protein, partial [Ktedonobacteraceae bacterium]|nr:universal stress protein [Ktedonobacteraceae bacterium]
MLQRLLVPLDGSRRSECVLSLAVRIAQATHGTLLLVRVVDPDTRKPSTATRTETCEKSADLQQASAYLLETRQRLPAALSVQCISCSGPIVPTLLALAKGHAIDLILLCHRGETGIREMGKRSVTHHLACQSPLPLLVLHPDRPIPESAYPNPLHPLHTTEV